jgi:hypothetical protein
MTGAEILDALFIQPQYGLPLLLLACSLIIWSAWQSQALPAVLAPYRIRPPWVVDLVRLLHESLIAGELSPTIRVTYTWLTQQFRRKYGLWISEFASWRGYFLRRRIPHRSQFRQAVRTLQAAFFYAQYAEQTSETGWLALWRRPRAQAQAQRTFARALTQLEALRGLLDDSPPGAGL